MKHLNLLAVTCLLISTAVPAACLAEKALWIHPNCKPLPTDKLGPFVHTSRGVLAIDTRSSYVSDDGGRTWSEPGKPAR